MNKIIGILAVAILSLTIACNDSNQGNQKEEIHKENSEHESAFTCPMHPEITGKEGDECPKCGMDLEAVEGHNHSKMNQGDGHEHSNIESSEREINQNNTKNMATTPILNAYFDIKNGLVADNDGETAKGATSLLEAFSTFNMLVLSDEIHDTYMEIEESAKEHAEHILKSPIDHQREHFEALSIDITDLIQLLGTDKVIYQDYCPMANNNKGALWLSEIEEIKNPYFGSEMLKCGSIKKQIN